MDKAIHVGNAVDEKAVAELGDQIEKIFRVGFETRQEQETIRHALDVLIRGFSISNVSISNNTIHDDSVTRG